MPDEIPETPEGVQKHPLQIDISKEMERHIVDLVRKDVSSFTVERDNKDYGITAKGDRLDFDGWYKQITDLYNGRREPKTVPWKFASNRSLRIATSILDTLHARLLPTIVNQELLRWKSQDFKDTPKLERIEKLMQYWIWKRAGMQDFFDIWLKLCAGYGDVFSETTYEIDPVDSGELVQVPVTDEQGQQLQEQDGQPSFVSFRDIKLNEKTKTKAYLKNQVLLSKRSCDISKEPAIIIEDVFYRDLEKGEEEGKFTNVSTELRQMIPVEVSDDPSADEQEIERLRMLELRNKPITIHREYLSMDIDGDGFPEDIRVNVCLEHNLYLGGVAIKNLTKTGKRPIHFQKFDNRLDRPNENDGEGVLEKVKELAEEIDAIFNQLTDANTLSILRPGFYDPAGDVDAPILRLAPNRMLPVTDPQRNIAFPDISVQVGQLLQAINLVLEFVERLTAASAFVFGKEGEFAGGSGTATRTQAIVQAAETRFQRPAERMRKGAAEIIRQHLDILQLNIPPGLETRILGEKGEPVFDTNELSKEGISGEFDAYLLSDPALGSKQADRELSQMLYSLLIQNPIVGTDPVKIYKLTADFLKSWDKNPEELLGPGPSQDDIDDPEDENTLIVQGDFGRVRAQITENHLLHIQTHMQLIQSPSLAQVPPALIQQIVEFTQAHIQEHQQQMQLMLAMQQKIAGGGGGEPGTTGRTEGTPEPSGVEQAGGPLAQALGRQQQGESGQSSSI